MSRFRFLYKYLKYKLTARHRRAYGIHSPFLYALIRDVFMKKAKYYFTEEIDDLRYDLLCYDEVIQVKDFGAGSKLMRSEFRKIKDIAKYSAVNKKYGELLFRMLDFFKPNTILELGTSLGIGTLYLALANSKSVVYTIEACPETAKIAKENFNDLNAQNIKLIEGNFSEKLPHVLNSVEKIDFVVFDGNHLKEATLNYFNLCIKKSHNDSIFYFDDIHWSKEMEEAWKIIKSNVAVTLTVDLFFSGIVFFKKELSKQDFVIRF